MKKIIKMRKLKIKKYIDNSNVSRFRFWVQILSFILFVYGGYFLIEIASRLPLKNIVVYPNSGEMYNAKHKTWFGDFTTLDFSKKALQWKQAGARLIGGCCRTGPGHISNLRKILLKNDTINEGGEF